MKQTIHCNCKLTEGSCKQITGLLHCFTSQMRACVFKGSDFGYTELVWTY